MEAVVIMEKIGRETHEEVNHVGLINVLVLLEKKEE
jgi:hypothetical protein